MDLTKLNGIIPASVVAEIPYVMNKFQINTPLRLSHFLGQAAHESGDFKVVEENLNYSAQGLSAIFGKYFPGNLNESYARQPQKIANRVYANRMGNGTEISGDGWNFRGRGYIQLTGKLNYEGFSNVIGINLLSISLLTTTDLVSQKYPLSSAAWFFSKTGLNEIADQGSTDEIVTSITRKVNGGILGLSHRIQEFNKFYNLLK